MDHNFDNHTIHILKGPKYHNMGYLWFLLQSLLWFWVDTSYVGTWTVRGYTYAHIHIHVMITHVYKNIVCINE